MNEQQFTVGELYELLEPDFERGTLRWKPRGHNTFDDRFAGTMALACEDSYGYRQGSIKGVRVKAHRVLFYMFHGRLEHTVDHKDGNRSNNAIQNLRELTNAEQQKSQSLYKKNKTGVPGVFYDGRKWRANIGNSALKENRLGRFDTFEEAVAARHAEAQRRGYFPEHGRTKHEKS